MTCLVGRGRRARRRQLDGPAVRPYRCFLNLMSGNNLKIGFVRRGYSPSGGAEAYLKRLARGVSDLGHEVVLFATEDWPPNEWPFGALVQIKTKSIIGFADEVEKRHSANKCDLLLSLERVWRCDVYRAGDGVHQAWLNRRQKLASPWQHFVHKFNPKHRDVLKLEQSLFGERCAERVIVNSKMVKDEIFDFYSYRPDRIDIVRTGIPLDQFRFDPARREKSRADLGLEMDEVAVLFVGSGWERKGLCYAVEAVESCPNLRLRLLVAGRGETDRYRSTRAKFLGEVFDPLPIYAAADIFILPTIYDPFSNACLEALACGLPVITTRANGFCEIMEDRIQGSIIDSGDDISDLSSALEDWSDPTRRAAARPSILKRAAQFDISRNLNDTVRILMAAAANRSGSAGC
jgi:UDP-glucose:(heptosyl)LPS alpha-1,3-glucosyltransferase